MKFVEESFEAIRKSFIVVNKLLLSNLRSLRNF